VRDLKAEMVARYGEKILAKSALRLRDGADILRRVLAGKGYRVALEIGTFKGCSTALMAQHCERVVTIDLERKAPKFDREAFWRSLGLANVTLRLVRDDSDKLMIVDSLDFDFAFIDGAHDAVSVQRDFEMVRRCGHVLFHDYNKTASPERRQVADFVDRLPKRQVRVMDIFALWTAP